MHLWWESSADSSWQSWQLGVKSVKCVTWSFRNTAMQNVSESSQAKPKTNITTTIIQLKEFFFYVAGKTSNLIYCFLLQMSIFLRKIWQIGVQEAVRCNHYLSDRQTDRGNSNYFMQSRLELGVTRIFLVWLLHWVQNPGSVSKLSCTTLSRINNSYRHSDTLTLCVTLYCEHQAPFFPWCQTWDVGG